MVKTGNYIETYVQLPDKVGAWPCLFTWNSDEFKELGKNEVDIFEYHRQNEHVLELTSHLHDDRHETPCNYTREWIKPLAWVKLGVVFGYDEIIW